jgi:hypothetical protein
MKELFHREGVAQPPLLSPSIIKVFTFFIKLSVIKNNKYTLCYGHNALLKGCQLTGREFLGLKNERVLMRCPEILLKQ